MCSECIIRVGIHILKTCLGQNPSIFGVAMSHKGCVIKGRRLVPASTVSSTLHTAPQNSPHKAHTDTADAAVAIEERAVKIDVRDNDERLWSSHDMLQFQENPKHLFDIERSFHMHMINTTIPLTTPTADVPIPGVADKPHAKPTKKKAKPSSASSSRSSQISTEPTLKLPRPYSASIIPNTQSSMFSTPSLRSAYELPLGQSTSGADEGHKLDTYREGDNEDDDDGENVNDPYPSYGEDPFASNMSPTSNSMVKSWDFAEAENELLNSLSAGTLDLVRAQYANRSNSAAQSSRSREESRGAGAANDETMRLIQQFETKKAKQNKKKFSVQERINTITRSAYTGKMPVVAPSSASKTSVRPGSSTLSSGGGYGAGLPSLDDMPFAKFNLPVSRTGGFSAQGARPSTTTSKRLATPWERQLLDIDTGDTRKSTTGQGRRKY